MQTLPSGMGMPQQGCAGVFAPQRQLCRRFFTISMRHCLRGRRNVSGEVRAANGSGSEQLSRRPSDQSSVGGSDAGEW